MEETYMKKILVCLLCAALCLGGFSLAEESEWYYDTSWGYVNGYSGSGGDVVVPSEIDGHAVRVIQQKGLTRRDDITSFTVPEGTLVLGSHVMSNAKNLTSVSLPQTLQVIGLSCFFHCEALTELTIPASVRLIGDGALCWLSSLKTLTFEGPCPVLQNSANTLVTNPRDLVIYVPDDQLEAYRTAFDHVSPEQFQPSGRNALPQSELHAEFEFDPETGTILRATSEDTWIDIPSEIDGIPVRRIGERAFSDNDFCYAIRLPEGLEEIGDRAFDGLSRLWWAPIPSTVRIIGEEAYYLYGGLTLTIPAGVTEISRRAFYQSGLSMELIVPDGVTKIGEEAFGGTNLYAVNLPPSLKEIGEKAFSGNYLSRIHLETLELPAIAENAFEKQSHAIKVTLPPAAGEAEVAAAQAFFDTLGDNFTVSRLSEPNGFYPDSPYAHPPVTEAPSPAPTDVPAETPAPTDVPAENTPVPPAPAPAASSGIPEIEGVSLDPQDYVGTWYSIYYGTGGFTGDPRSAFDWQDIMILNADGTVDGNLGGDMSTWGVDPDTGYIIVGPVITVLLPDGYLQSNNRISGYMIFSRDPDAVWDPETPMYEDLVQAAMGGAENVPEPAPDPAPVAVPAAEGAPQASAEGSIPTETKLVCTRYMAGGYEMDASILGGELSVILHSDGSFGFNMLGNEVAGLAWTWDGNEAVVDYFGAGQLRLTPLEDGTVSMNFLDTMTYILAVP